MKYFITTLAIGEPYFTKSLELYIDLHEKTTEGYFNITTSEKDLILFSQRNGLSLEDFLTKYPKLQITTVEQFNRRFEFPLHMEGVGFTFNLNLKVLALKAALLSGRDFDNLIFIDGDWSLHENFKEVKILQFLYNLEVNKIDLAFERPAQIGNYKKGGLVDCFFEEKLRDYNVLEHDVWDEAHVVNEQFLAFQNNFKFKLFVQKWEQWLWYSIANNIRNYPDGFEIGVAALESKMKWSWFLFTPLQECFFFYAKYNDNKYIKF